MNTKFFNHYPREWDTLGNEWKEIITGDVLSISQASELSGFSKRFIYAQIHSMKLLSTDKDPLSKQIYSKSLQIEWRRFLMWYSHFDVLLTSPFGLPVKQASLFAIYTGLRRSDVLALDWRNLHLRSKKNAYMTLIIHKTQNKVRLPLSESAVKLLGEPLKEGVVFNGLTEHALNKYVPMLIKTADISKHITFHRFRDTFAMRLLDNGVDIYTIATLLGHKQVSSTQIYVRLSPQKARTALMKLK